MAWTIIFANYDISSSAVMSPKKSPDICKDTVEAEIASLAGENSGSTKPQSDLQPIQKFLSDFLSQQNSQHTALLKTITENQVSSNQAILSAVNQILPNPQRTSSEFACPSQIRSPVVRQELFTSESAEREEMEEVEGDRSFTDSEIMHPDFLDFEGWDIPASGTTSEQHHDEVPLLQQHRPQPAPIPHLALMRNYLICTAFQ